MGKLKKALAKAKEQRGPGKAKDYIDSINNSSQIVSRGSATVKEYLIESNRDINPIVEKREDISIHQLNRESEHIRDKIKNAVMDRKDIPKKNDQFRTEKNNHFFSKKKNYLFTLLFQKPSPSSLINIPG